MRLFAECFFCKDYFSKVYSQQFQETILLRVFDFPGCISCINKIWYYIICFYSIFSLVRSCHSPDGSRAQWWVLWRSPHVKSLRFWACPPLLVGELRLFGADGNFEDRLCQCFHQFLVSWLSGRLHFFFPGSFEHVWTRFCSWNVFIHAVVLHTSFSTRCDSWEVVPKWWI